MKICSVEGCEVNSRANGMCAVHNARMKRRGTIELKEIPKVPLAKCLNEKCEELTNSQSGLCPKHYKQAHYLKTVGRDALIERTSQERWTNMATGYVMVKHNGKLTYEHIVLAEKALGKPLPKGAIVHHVGERDDNVGYCKLIVCPSQEYHLLLHKRMTELGL